MMAASDRSGGLGMAPEHGPMRMNTGMHEFGRIDNTVARARGSGPRMRCLLGMLGMDIHTKGIRTLARQLRDRGVEIVYVGEHNTVDGLVRTAIVEDVDVIGLSFSVSRWNTARLKPVSEFQCVEGDGGHSESSYRPNYSGFGKQG